MSCLLVERPRAGVVLLRLNRPEQRNALDLELRAALAAAFEAVAADDTALAVVITGNDKAFAAGADLNLLLSDGPSQNMARRLDAYWTAIAGCRKPVIAAVEGYALGAGCELAMHADIIVAAAGAKFGQPEVKLGMMPGAGGTQRLLRAVGKYRAMLLTLTGATISGTEAYAMGLCSTVVEDGTVLDTALQLAQTIAAMPRLAVEQIKEVILAGADAPLDAALRLERKSFQLLLDTADQKEGVRAFLEKRAPKFEGK